MDTPKRYSDEVPYEKRRYWYFTTHGLGPGTIPKDLKVLETREGPNDKGTWGDYVCLDGVMNTDELKTFDMRELAPHEYDGKMREDAFIEKFLDDHDFMNCGYFECVYKDEDGIHIDGVEGDWKHTHAYLRELMYFLGYTQKYEHEVGNSESDYYTANHCYVKKGV